MEYTGSLKYSAKYENFINSPIPELWNKIIHLFLLMDMDPKKDKKIFIQNKYLMERFGATRAGIQQAIRKLENMEFITRRVTRRNKRIIKINRAKIIPFLRCYNIESPIYKEQANWSKERRFIRKKIISLVDFIKAPQRYQEEQFQKYVEAQIDHYNYDELPTIEAEKILYTKVEADAIADEKTKDLQKQLVLERLYNQIM